MLNLDCFDRLAYHYSSKYSRLKKKLLGGGSSSKGKGKARASDEISEVDSQSEVGNESYRGGYENLPKYESDSESVASGYSAPSSPYRSFTRDKEATGYRSQREDYNQNQYELLRQESTMSIEEQKAEEERKNLDVLQRMGMTYDQALRTYRDESGDYKYVSWTLYIGKIRRSFILIFLLLSMMKTITEKPHFPVLVSANLQKSPKKEKVCLDSSSQRIELSRV